MTKQLQSETLQFNLYKMYRMTKQVSHSYFAPNHHLCQNYTESGSFLTIHKNIKASIHKNAQDSTIVECNFYDTNAIVTDWFQVVSNPLRLFRGLNDCKHYLFHPRQATFYTYREGTK